MREPPLLEPARLLGGCDALVHASHATTRGMVARAVMACGHPLVAYERGKLNVAAK